MNTRMQAIWGDITRFEADVIVNAANTSLMGGGGVDGAIHRAGGPAILEDCRKIVARQGGCKTGEAVITTAGRLPAAYVIHTPGPVWNGGSKNEAELLAACYFNVLQLAAVHEAVHIAFPNISTGIYGFPKGPAAGIAVQTVREYLQEHETPFRVSFVCLDEENFNLYRQLLQQH